MAKSKQRDEQEEESQNTPISTIKLNGTNCIKAQRSVFQGRESIDIRRFYKANENEEEWKPTAKGVSIPIAKAGKMCRKILQELETNPPETDE